MRCLWQFALSAAKGITLVWSATLPQLACAHANSAANAAPRNTLVIDHTERKARFQNAVVEDGDQIRMRSPHNVVVQVKNSNSALYECQVSATKTSTPELDATLGFMKALGPYLIEGAVMRAGKQVSLYSLPQAVSGTGHISDKAREIENVLVGIDEILFDPTGLHPLFARTAHELDRMRLLESHQSIDLTSYRDFAKLTCVMNGTECRELRAVRQLASALDSLGKIHGPFAEMAKNSANDTLKELAARSASALADADGMLGLAYLVERMVQRTLSATKTFSCSPRINLSLFSGRDATVTLSASSVSEIARVASSSVIVRGSTAEPYALKVSARPDWLIRPTLGLSFVAVPDGEYPKFGTKTINDTTHKIRTAGSTDARFTYGLVLATTWRFLDWRDKKFPAAFYLPELTVNPSNDIKAAGIGIGVSLSRVKFGFGYAVTKHSVLANGQQLDATLRDPEELSVRDAYGKRKFYWSVSLIGLPPFLPP